MVKDQNIFEYHKIKILKELKCPNSGFGEQDLDMYILLYNKLNEVIIELNRVQKDLELYKKAFKDFVKNDRTI